MKYLVTGGAGFIGSHLCEALVRRGDEVTVLDNFSAGTLENIAHLEGSVRVAHGSILDPLLVDELMEGTDVVVHLAAAVGVRLIVEQPLRSLITNIHGTENVLEAARRYGSKALLASTSEIYGKSSERSFKEDDDRVLGSTKVSRWSYSLAKGVDESLAFAYHREHSLPIVITRMFNIVGPRQTGEYGMVVPRFIGAALRNEPIVVFDDGQQTRCFCHVDDLVAGLLDLLDEPSAEGDVFNVGSTEEVTILELAERVVARTGSSSRIDKVPYEEAYEEGFEDMRRRVPDITKIRSLIGWEPSRDLDQIIDDVADYMRRKP